MAWLKVPALGLTCCEGNCVAFKFSGMAVSGDASGSAGDFFTAATRCSDNCCLIQSAAVSLVELSNSVTPPASFQAFPAPIVVIRGARDAEPKGFYADIYVPGATPYRVATYPVLTGCDELSPFIIDVELNDVELDLLNFTGTVSYSFSVALLFGCPEECFCPGVTGVPLNLGDGINPIGTDADGATLADCQANYIDISLDGFPTDPSDRCFLGRRRFILYWNPVANAWQTIASWNNGVVYWPVFFADGMGGGEWVMQGISVELTCAGHLTIKRYEATDLLPGDLICTIETDIVPGESDCEFTFEEDYDCGDCTGTATGGSPGTDEPCLGFVVSIGQMVAVNPGVGTSTILVGSGVMTNIPTTSLWVATIHSPVQAPNAGGLTDPCEFSVTYDQSTHEITITNGIGLGLGTNLYTNEAGAVTGIPGGGNVVIWAGKHLDGDPGASADIDGVTVFEC